jgi:RNA polymerase sigma factor (sigma-70 family)
VGSLDPVRLAVAPLLRCQTDERLVELARAGHESAFEAIVERYRRPLLRYCGRLLSPCRAEDAVQQVFFGAYRTIRNGEDGEIHLRPWLYRAAHNASIDALRQNGSSGESDRHSNGEERTDESWESRENLRDLIASLRALPERQRDAIVLRELEGRGHEEIAGMLGLSESAARQLIHRARTSLRAGASALAPSGYLAQLLLLLRTDPVPTRIPELVGGGSAAVTFAKVGAAGLVAGAIAMSGSHSPAPSGVLAKGKVAAEAKAAPIAEQSGSRAVRLADRTPAVPVSAETHPAVDVEQPRAGAPARHELEVVPRVKHGDEAPAHPRRLDPDGNLSPVPVVPPAGGGDIEGEHGNDHPAAQIPQIPVQHIESDDATDETDDADDDDDDVVVHYDHDDDDDD